MQSLAFNLGKYFLGHICGNSRSNKESEWRAVLKPGSYTKAKYSPGFPGAELESFGGQLKRDKSTFFLMIGIVKL